MKDITSNQMLPYVINPTDESGKPSSVTDVKWGFLDQSSFANGQPVAGAQMVTADQAPALFAKLGLPTDGRAAILYPDDTTFPTGFPGVQANATLAAGGSAVILEAFDEEVNVTHPQASNIGLTPGVAVPKEPLS